MANRNEKSSGEGEKCDKTAGDRGTSLQCIQSLDDCSAGVPPVPIAIYRYIWFVCSANQFISNACQVMPSDSATWPNTEARPVGARSNHRRINACTDKIHAVGPHKNARSIANHVKVEFASQDKARPLKC